MSMRITLLGVFLFCAVGLSAETLTGTITDTMCGAKHTMGGSSPAECVRECAKAGSDYGLVVGDKVYTLKGDKAQFDKFAGQKVSVTGKVSGETLTADSVSAAK